MKDNTLTKFQIVLDLVMIIVIVTGMIAGEKTVDLCELLVWVCIAAVSHLELLSKK